MGCRKPRIPAKNPAAHPPAAPFSASSFSLVLATTDSVKANVAPIAPVHPEFKHSEPSQWGDFNFTQPMDAYETGRCEGKEEGRTKEPNRPTCPGQKPGGTVVVRAESVLDRAHESPNTSCLDSYGRCVAESSSRLEGFCRDAR